MTRSGRQGWRAEVCRDRTSSQTDRRQRGGRRTQCEAPISLRGRGDCKGERGVPLYPFTCPVVTFRHEHKGNGTLLLSRIFPPSLSPGKREKTGRSPHKAFASHPGINGNSNSYHWSYCKDQTYVPASVRHHASVASSPRPHGCG